MGLLKIYVLLLFGISAILYMFGYSPPLLYFWNATSTSGGAAVSLMSSFIAIFFNPSFLAIAGVSSVAAYLSGGGNFSVIYIIPIFLAVAMLNYFVMPTSFILTLDLDPLISMIVLGFLNILMVLAIMEFVRGA